VPVLSKVDAAARQTRYVRLLEPKVVSEERRIVSIGFATSPGPVGERPDSTRVMVGNGRHGDQDGSGISKAARRDRFGELLSCQRIANLSEDVGIGSRVQRVGFQKEGTLDFQNLSPLTCPLA